MAAPYCLAMLLDRDPRGGSRSGGGCDDALLISLTVEALGRVEQC